MANISKKFTLSAVALLLFVSLTQAARTEPADPSKARIEDVGETITGNIDEVCEGVGEEECLARRTLIAHTDYIYTQGKGKGN